MACTRLISAAVPQRETSESGLRARSRYHHVSLFAALLKNALSNAARPLSPSPRSERLLQRRAVACRRVRRPEGARDACAVGAVAR